MNSPSFTPRHLVELLIKNAQPSLPDANADPGAGTGFSGIAAAITAQSEPKEISD
tara:strand:- start:9863 stop:10027 length:165 start_codon:yes stop_codon:yes gene_type:complete